MGATGGTPPDMTFVVTAGAAGPGLSTGSALGPSIGALGGSVEIGGCVGGCWLDVGIVGEPTCAGCVPLTWPVVWPTLPLVGAGPQFKPPLP